MSALVPGQEPLLRRICLGHRLQEVKTWFGAIEAKAWAYVNAENEVRPQKIFLVVGQILTSEYSISHQETGTTSCKIELSFNTDLPPLGSAKLVTGYECERVQSSAGFQLVKRKSESGDSLHSIFLKVVESKPMSFIRKASLIQRLVQVHRYTRLR